MFDQRLAKFLSNRGGSQSWGQSPEFIQACRQGCQLGVPPLTTEYACILDCNASCPTCSYRRPQLTKCKGVVPIGQIATSNDRTSGSISIAKMVIERSYEAGVRGMLYTGGGEPTIFQGLVESLRYSSSLRMTNGLYTNGFAFGYDPDLPRQIMDMRCGLALVRISVNAISGPAVKRHWGLKNPDDIDLQLNGVVNLIAAREELAETSPQSPLPSIQISTIVDRHNVSDLALICETIADIFKKTRITKGAEDVMIVRPTTVYGRKSFSSHDHTAEVIQQILQICQKNIPGNGHDRLAQAGVPLFLGFGLNTLQMGGPETYDNIIEKEYRQRNVSLSNGVFLTVGPDANVYISTEYNCGPDSTAIGNLKQQSVKEIYWGDKRRQQLEFMNSHRWGPEVSQPTPRTARLDRIATAIHSGALTDNDIQEIGLLSLNSHQLLLD